jgi:hypothetical protein
MTEIEIHQPSTAVAVPGSPSVDLRAWADQAAAAYTYADAVCRTQMVPAAYKGKPDEACAAILAGAELGFGPMASLRAFHPINGTPAPAAITLRAVVTGHGHEVVVEESSGTRAVVSGRRKGAEAWQTSVWDIERASKLPQYATNKNYQHNPGAMLVARATAEVCRWIASDAIMGMPYAAEEIDDQPALSPSPVARKLTLADLDAQPAVEAAPVEPMTDQQRKAMFGLWADLGYDNASDADRATRLKVIAQILGLDSLETTSDLNRDQADQVLAAFRARRDAEQGGAE